MAYAISTRRAPRWTVQRLVALQLHGAGPSAARRTLLATSDWRSNGSTSATTAFRHHDARLAVARHTVASARHRRGEVATARPGAFFLVLTHEHAIDLRIAEAILRRGDFGFFGLIGSKTKRASFERRLRDRGVDGDAIARMTCPIGIDGIDGKEPEVIAMAVVAQLIARADKNERRLLSGAGRDRRALRARWRQQCFAFPNARSPRVLIAPTAHSLCGETGAIQLRVGPASRPRLRAEPQRVSLDGIDSLGERAIEGRRRRAAAASSRAQRSAIAAYRQ